MFRCKLFALIWPVFVLLDGLWLGLLARDFYRREMWPLLRKSGESLAPVWPAAGVVYLVIPLGLVMLVQPLVAGGSVLQACGMGALFGFVVYATYDFTNLALLADWSWRVTLVDVIWGSTLCAVVSVAMQQAGKWLAS